MEAYQSEHPMASLYHWLYQHYAHNSDHILVRKDERPDHKALHVYFDYEALHGVVTLWDNEIIEEHIMSDDEGDLYYLHYPYIDQAQFTSLTKEFYEAFKQRMHYHPLKVVFCCSSGLSASYLSERMNQVIALENTPIQTYALSLDKLEQEASSYDMVYLTPQVAHLRFMLSRKVPDAKKIDILDPTLFATMDIQKILETIKEKA